MQAPPRETHGTMHSTTYESGNRTESQSCNLKCKLVHGFKHTHGLSWEKTSYYRYLLDRVVKNRQTKYV